MSFTKLRFMAGMLFWILLFPRPTHKGITWYMECKTWTPGQRKGHYGLTSYLSTLHLAPDRFSKLFYPNHCCQLLCTEGISNIMGCHFMEVMVDTTMAKKWEAIL